MGGAQQDGARIDHDGAAARQDRDRHGRHADILDPGAWRMRQSRVPARPRAARRADV
jgi:hypothetical protein